MVQLCMTLQGDYLPYQLSFNGALFYIMPLFVERIYSSLYAISRLLRHFYSMDKA